MEIFDIPAQFRSHDPRQHSYTEIFRATSLSLGLATWPANDTDKQRPHSEDEVYYVVEGRGQIRVAEEDRPVHAGSVIFVARGVSHHFHSIEETLQVIVFWSPPHHSLDDSTKGPTKPLALDPSFR